MMKWLDITIIDGEDKPMESGFIGEK